MRVQALVFADGIDKGGNADVGDRIDRCDQDTLRCCRDCKDFSIFCVIVLWFSMCENRIKDKETSIKHKEAPIIRKHQGGAYGHFFKYFQIPRSGRGTECR